MKRLTGKLEDLFISITFAEEREFASIREALTRTWQKIEDTQTAIAFAEAGEIETTAGCVSRGGKRPKPGRIVSPAGGRSRACPGRA